jgi:two-component system sensor histidine kinase ChvG
LPRRGRLSPLTLRILAINVVALALLGGGLFYLGEYQQNLVATQTEALKTQGQIFAAALGEGAVDATLPSGPALQPERAREMMRRLVEPTHMRARLFDAKGALIADSRILGISKQSIQIEEIPAPDQSNFLVRLAHSFYDDMIARIPWSHDYPPDIEIAKPSAADYPAVGQAYQGEIAVAVHSVPASGGLIIAAAVPVQNYKEVLGVVLLSSGSGDIEQAVRSVRFSIAELFLVALAVTVLLSIYLAGTIVRPLRLLAAAADRMRSGRGAQPEIPDFAARNDEIGDLSVALREMTETIRRRMDAIEHFAADVAHELKNPLTSLRSAVETALRVGDAEKQKQLLRLVLEDAKRLDRLITDISDASRLDAEMSRAERSIVPLGSMLAALVAVYRDAAGADSPFLALDLPGGVGGSGSTLNVRGNEERLVRVFRNLLDNAISFSPPGGTITVRARRTGDMIRVAVEDAGPGIPEGKLGAIFDRFYSERPKGEDFGTHSGLGLAISKQIAEAHHGTIRAENRYDGENRLRGARFMVDLPADFGSGGRSRRTDGAEA